MRQPRARASLGGRRERDGELSEIAILALVDSRPKFAAGAPTAERRPRFSICHIMLLQPASSEAFVQSPVEPKLYFANERTFLHWMHACVTLASIAIALTAASSAETPYSLAAGIILSFASIGLMGYAYWTFNWRASRIAERAGKRADDPLGPALLSTVLIAAMIAAAVCTLPKAL